MTATVSEQTKYIGFSCDEEIVLLIWAALICPFVLEYATIAINFSLLRHWQCHLKEQIYWRKADSYSPVSSKSARSRHYSISSQKWDERSRESRMLSSRKCTWVLLHADIENIDNQYSQSIVCSSERCRNNKFKKTLMHGVGMVDVMPRAGSHYNLGTSRGPDKIGSRAGPGHSIATI